MLKGARLGPEEDTEEGTRTGAMMMRMGIGAEKASRIVRKKVILLRQRPSTPEAQFPGMTRPVLDKLPGALPPPPEGTNIDLLPTKELERQSTWRLSEIWSGKE